MKGNHFNRTVRHYTLFGVIFGVLFPLFAYIFELSTLDLEFNFQNIYEIHSHNKLLFMIDSAPLFLGLFAYVIGLKSARLGEINQSLKQQAMTDDLTSLHNRRYAKMKLQTYISISGKDSRFGIFLIDLDKFKNINDTLGHSFGDKLLVVIANRLMSQLSTIGTIARIGGDEFLVIVENMVSTDDFVRAKNKLLDVFLDPFIIEDKKLSIQASIGVAIYPTDGDGVETLLRKADIAMYSCKHKTNSSYALYLESMSEALKRAVDLEYHLKNCVKDNEFYLLYQPIMDTRYNHIIGVEALLRWNNPKLGMVPPDSFIPIAEDIGLIHDIGKWVLYNACIQGKKWHDQSIMLYVSVNVSVEELKDIDFLKNFKCILDETEFNPEFLHVEITENVSAASIINIGYLFETLHSYGVKVSFDDFGTGYSSLALLKTLDINTLKIDRTFISNLHINVTNKLITSTIIKLANNLGLNVIAEGVETKEQLEFLSSEACYHVQGFLYSKPISPHELEVYISTLQEEGGGILWNH